MNERDLLRILVEFAVSLTGDFSIQDILDRLTEQIVGLLPVTGAGVLLMDDGGRHHFLSATDDQLLRIEGLQVELGEGPCLTAYETDRPVAVVDLSSDVLYPRFSPAASEVGLGAVFSFPLRHGGARLGALELYVSEPVVLTVTELDGGQTLADVTASYLSIARRREGSARAALVMAEAALTDPLTGLANRRLLEDRLDQAMDRSGRSRRCLAVLFCDIDRFKVINDRFGHHAGDRLLVELASRLTACLRPEDTLARISGDEFVIVCEGLTDTVQAEEVAARVLAALTEPFLLADGGPSLLVGMSIGITLAGPGHNTVEGALIGADAAMYRAKRRGGNQQVTATDLSLEERDRERGIDADLDAPAIMCVNVSFAELLQPGHATMGAEVLAATGLHASSLVIEVTEHTPLTDTDEAALQLRGLAQLGITVALDDFGTGYSSLAHLQAFPVGVLKLDRSFVTQIGGDPTDEAIAGAVVALARDLGIAVIAEGIETAEQFAHIHELGIERSQGYHHSAPVHAGALASLLRAGPEPPGRSGLPPAAVVEKPT